MSALSHNFMQQWFDEVWHAPGVEGIDRLAHPEGQCHGFPEPDSVIDRTEFKKAVTEFKKAFPDLRFVIEDSISEGNKMCVRWTLNMTHTGDGMGFAPTGKKLKVLGMAFIELRDGKLLSGWNAVDMTKLKQQLQS